MESQEGETGGLGGQVMMSIGSVLKRLIRVLGQAKGLKDID